MVDPDQDVEAVLDEDEEQYEDEDQETQLLQHFQAQDEHGNTIVLTAEQMQRYQDQIAQQVLEGGGEEEEEGMMIQSVEDVETQEIVNDILDNELETQEILDEVGTHHVTNAELQQLITLHSVDAEGNIITRHPNHEEEDESVHHHMDLGHVEDEIQIGHDENIDGSMMETDNIEEVITSNQDDEDFDPNFVENNADLTHSFLSVRDSVFNPVTGTLQPISSVMANTSLSQLPPPKPKKPKQQVKYVIANSSRSSDGNQLLLNASQLQGLLQGGGNTITLSGASGKQSILITSSPQKSKPAKILPAPMPIGDQQQGTGSPQRILLRQGNVLTPVSISGSSPKFIQMTGSGNQVQYLRVVPNKQQMIPLNKLPIAPSKPKFVAPKSSGQSLFSLSAGNDLHSFQNSGFGNLMMLPSNYVMKTEHSSSSPVAIRPNVDHAAASEQAMLTLQQNLAAQQQAGFESFRSLLEPNGMRPRKPCNCTKSQCLKLYCDCFANGEFCHLCNCTNCYNNLTHEEDRQKAIKLVLERNPGAFRPKIGKSSQTGEAHERRHNKGCNCRRSGCLKNYCECYEAKIFCSGICKCTGCKNCIENIPSGLPNGVGVEQHFAGAGTSHRQTLKDLAEAAEVRVQQQNQVKNKMKAQWQDVSTQNNIGVTVPAVVFRSVMNNMDGKSSRSCDPESKNSIKNFISRYPQGSISYEVVTSTVDLLLAKAEAGEKQRLGEGELERVLIEEFGECLSALMELGTTPGHD